MLQQVSLRRNLWWLWVALGLSVGGLVLVFFFTREGDTWAFILGVDPRYMVMAAAVVFLMWLTEAARVRSLVALVGGSIPLTEVLRLNLAVNFMAAITPMASGGPPAQVYFLYQRGMPLSASLAVVGMRLVLSLFFFVVVAPLAVLLYGGVPGFGSGLNNLVLIGVVLVVAAVVAAGLLLSRPGLVEGLLDRVLSWPPLRRLQKPAQTREVITDQVVGVRRSLKLLFASGRHNLQAQVLVFTVLFWALFFSLAPLLLQGLGIEAPLISVMVRQVVVYFLIAYVPLPGASGVAELGVATLFSSLVPAPLLLGFVGTWRFFTYYINILIGGPIFARLVGSANQPAIF